MSDERSTAQGYSFAAFLLLLFGLIAGGYFAWDSGFRATAGVIAAVGICSASGFRLGGIYFLVMLAGMLAAVVYAPVLGGMLEPTLIAQFEVNGLMARALAIGGAGAAFMLVAVIVASLLSSRLRRSSPGLAVANQWFGVGVGSCQGICVAGLALGGLLTVEPMLKRNENEPTIRASQWRSQVVDGALGIIGALENDPAGDYVRQYNPFERIPRLSALSTSIELANNPQAMQEMVGQLSTEKLGETPAVQAAVAELSRDPDLQPFLTQGKPLDQQAMSSLMTNPAVLKLLDDPDVQAQLKQMTNQMSQR